MELTFESQLLPALKLNLPALGRRAMLYVEPWECLWNQCRNQEMLYIKNLLRPLVHQFSDSESHAQTTFIRKKKMTSRFFKWWWVTYRPLKSTERHGCFLNLILRQGLFLKSTADMGTYRSDKRYGVFLNSTGNMGLKITNDMRQQGWKLTSAWSPIGWRFKIDPYGWRFLFMLNTIE